ncbi:MAG TPA: DinB family protein [Vicinamibacteria bacterium]
MDHPETDARALAILSATPRRLEKLTSSLTPRNAAASPVRGKWSAKEIIAHLNDGEIVYGLRYRRIAAEPGTPLAAFDQELWAKELQYRKQPLKANLQSFAALRKQNLALLKVLPKGVWTQASPHPEYGTLSLRELVVHLAYHDRSHTSQVEQIASALGRNGKRKKSTKKRRKVARKAGRKRSPQPARRRGVAGPPPPRLRRVRRSWQTRKPAKAEGRAAGVGPRGRDRSRG